MTFFVLVIALAYGLDALISYGLRQIRTSKFGSLNQIVGGKVNAEVVINGSSRALNHYDPRIISQVTGLSSYNLGMNGVQVDVQLAILQTYLKHNAKPRLVIQNLETFIFEATGPGQIYDPGLYIPYLRNDELYNPLRAIDPAVWKWKHIPLYGYAVEDMRFTWVWGLLGCVGYSGGEDYFLGFNPRYMEWTEDFDRFKATVGEGKTYRIDQKGLTALSGIIETCRSQGIDLILVYSPEYFEMQSLVRNRGEIFTTLQKLGDQHRVPIWDYSDSPISRQRTNFYNSQHLNARGAETFSKDLAHRLRAHRLRPGESVR